MTSYLGLDIGIASLGFALIEYDDKSKNGKIVTSGVRIFQEALTGKGEETKKPRNVTRRENRLMRRQIRHRKLKRKFIRNILAGANLLPSKAVDVLERQSSDAPSHWDLRVEALERKLTAQELGVLFTHLSRRTGFAGSPKLSFEEQEEKAKNKKKKRSDAEKTAEEEEKEAKESAENIKKAMKEENYSTLGSYLADQEQKRNVKYTQDLIVSEFEAIWDVQSQHHGNLLTEDLKNNLKKAMLYRRPIFWRWKTIGKCRYEPDSELLMKSDWHAQQYIMLQNLNNLRFAYGNERDLSEFERKTIKDLMMSQAKVTFGGIRKALKKHWQEEGINLNSKFNFEVGQDERKELPGNATEAILRRVFGDALNDMPAAEDMRNQLAQLKWDIENTKVKKGAHKQYKGLRVELNDHAAIAAAKQEFIAKTTREWQISEAQAEELIKASLPSGWTRFSKKVIERLLPELENGREMTAILEEFYPREEQLLGENFDTLPSHGRHIDDIRNPVVKRCINQARKVVNNIIREYGKPDYIRIELARDVKLAGKTKNKALKINKQRRAMRKEAETWLEKNNFAPTRWTILKYLLWKEGNDRCLYSGENIGADDLFVNNRYQIEHIMPRSRSRDDSVNNLLLCKAELNHKKADQTPYEAFGESDKWDGMVKRVTHKDLKLPRAKIKRFLRTKYNGVDDKDEERAGSHLTDTAYAARQIRDFMAVLYPKGEAIDWAKGRPPRVQVVNGRSTSQLGQAWRVYQTFNKIFGNNDSNFKNRDDHRHHALDAIIIALTTPGRLQYIAQRYNEMRRAGKDYETIESGFKLRPPWKDFYLNMREALGKIIVSYQVDGKITGPLTDATSLRKRDDEVNENGNPVLVKRIALNKDTTPNQLASIRDPQVKDTINRHVDRSHEQGKPRKDAIKTAFSDDNIKSLRMPCKGTYSDGTPKNGPLIKRVKINVKQQPHLVVPLPHGKSVALKGDNHHVAFYQADDGGIASVAVSKLDALRRVQAKKPVVAPSHNGVPLLYYLCKRDMLEHVDKDTGEVSYWRVEILGEKQIQIVKHTDAAKITAIKPRHKKIAKDYRKVSVDPIGRLRKAK